MVWYGMVWGTANTSRLKVYIITILKRPSALMYWCPLALSPASYGGGKIGLVTWTLTDDANSRFGHDLWRFTT